jgi:hypothetical protein
LIQACQRKTGQQTLSWRAKRNAALTFWFVVFANRSLDESIDLETPICTFRIAAHPEKNIAKLPFCIRFSAQRLSEKVR